MRRTIVGFVAGFLLGATGFASAGYYYSAQDLLGLRGGKVGDAFVLGYVAGVHDVMAGPYPASPTKLAEVRDGAIELMLREQDPDKPAHLYVVGYLVRAQVIAHDDIARILPESWRGSEAPAGSKERF